MSSAANSILPVRKISVSHLKNNWAAILARLRVEPGTIKSYGVI